MKNPMQSRYDCDPHFMRYSSRAISNLATILLLTLLLVQGMTAQSNYWQFKNGGFGGFIYAIDVDSLGNVYFGSGGAGVFRTTDDGATWFQRNKGLPFTAFIHGLIICKSGTMLVGVERQGIFRSTNGGASWTQTLELHSMVDAFCFRSDKEVFAGSNLDESDISMDRKNPGLYGVFRSTDDGLTWVQTNNGLASLSVQCLFVDSSKNLFAGTSNGLFRSTDSGQSWANTSTGLVSMRVWSLIEPTNGTLLVGTDSGISRSTDKGGTWIKFNSGITNQFGYTPNINTFAVGHNGELFAGSTEYGAFRSVNNGNSWERLNSGFSSIQIQALVISKVGYIYAARYSFGVYRSVLPLSH